MHTGHAQRVAIAQGTLEGVVSAGVSRFLGIPFAAPCTGPRRWAPPAEPEAWPGVRAAASMGPSAPQRPTPYAWFGPVPEPLDEDCLYLNVWAPEPATAPKPVLVWIHGGAFVHGSGGEAVYDGTALARRGDIVVVTLNYRLGVLGFLGLNHLFADLQGCANLGILDQVAALRWVRSNIAAFGGDPERITIAGESAGGMSVATLLATRAADGLYHRAIIQSGGDYTIGSSAQSGDHARTFLEATGCTSLGELRALPVDALLAAQDEVGRSSHRPFDAREGPWASMRVPFQPTVDGTTLTDDGLASIVSRRAPKVPILVGCCADEWKLFPFLDRVEHDDELVARRLSRMFDDPGRTADLYRGHADGATSADVFASAVTDNLWVQPALQLAAAAADAGYPAYCYLMKWHAGTGCLHAFDVPFVFGNFPESDLTAMLGRTPPQRLVDAFQASWIAFVRTGDPSAGTLDPWPAYDGRRRAVAVLDAQASIVADPLASRRTAWQGRTSAERYRAEQR